MKRSKYRAIQNECLIVFFLSTVIIWGLGCSSPLSETKAEFNLRIYPSSLELEKDKEDTVSVWTDGANSRGEAARQMPSRSNENLRICQPSRRERPLLRISLATALSTRIKHRAINHLR